MLQSVGTGNLVRPFWSRLRHFFLYPFHPQPLVILLVLSLVSYMIAQVPGWYVGIDFLFWRIPRNFLFLLPFVFVFFKYAQSVLEETARGHLKPTSLTGDKLTSNGLIVIKMFAIYLVFVLLEFALLDLFGRIAEQVMRFIGAFVLPAAIMILAMEDRIAKALSPDVIASLILRIGAPYIILIVIFYMLFQFAFSQTLGIAASFISPELAAPVFAFIAMYFMLISFNMMGYLLYQHHEELGFDIAIDESEFEGKSEKDIVEVSPELRAAEILMQEGKTAEAIKQLEGVVRNSPMDIEARDRLLKLARLVGDNDIHTRQGQGYISYLFHENKISQAANIYQSCYEYDRNFKPAKATERLKLAEHLQQGRKYKLAMAVANNLHNDFPSFDGVPQAYLIVAHLLCEQFNEDVRARQVLEFVQKNYPDSALRDEIETYLDFVNNISNKK